MGYHTDFFGHFSLNRKLDKETFEYLKKFANTRRMARSMVGFGIEGEFYVDGKGYMGQEEDATVINGGRPPSTQPGLWCQWVPCEDGMGIEWDGGEKFYEYEAWLNYIINNFLSPKGYILNGSVRFQGEDSDDQGWILVSNNEVRKSFIDTSAPAFDPEPVAEVKPKRKRKLMAIACPTRRVNWRNNATETD